MWGWGSSPASALQTPHTERLICTGEEPETTPSPILDGHVPAGSALLGFFSAALSENGIKWQFSWTRPCLSPQEGT